MPDVHLWVRKDDWNKWKSIEDKPEWLHEHLNPRGTAKPVRQIIDETNQAIVESLGESEVLKARIAQKAKEREELTLDEEIATRRTKPSWCKEHNMEYEYCKGFKHGKGK